MSDDTMASGRAAAATQSNPQAVSSKADIPDAGLWATQAMVEAGAKCQMESDYNGHATWDEIHEDERRRYKVSARAIYAAMTSLTPAVIEARSDKTERLGPQGESAISRPNQGDV